MTSLVSKKSTFRDWMRRLGSFLVLFSLIFFALKFSLGFAIAGFFPLSEFEALGSRFIVRFSDLFLLVLDALLILRFFSFP